MVHAHLHPEPGGGWNMSRTNAGHPPPLLRAPDGTVRWLDEHGVLLYHGLYQANRADHRLHLPPGSTLLLYTDGLVERRGHDLDDAITRTADLLAATDPSTPLPDLLHRLADRIPGHPADDDIVLLALRVPYPALRDGTVG